MSLSATRCARWAYRLSWDRRKWVASEFTGLTAHRNTHESWSPKRGVLQATPGSLGDSSGAAAFAAFADLDRSSLCRLPGDG